jgi:lysophospholipase L1-like esterase
MSKKKHRCLILGASHAKKLHAAILKNKEFVKTYEVLSAVTPGAISSQLYFPNILSEFEEGDVLIIIGFGNDVFVKHLLFTRPTIHLTQFEPTATQELEKRWALVKSKLKKLTCQVKIIDNIYRHLYCCENHIHRGIAKYQKDTNTQLRTFFGEQSINHLSLLDKSRSLRKAAVYSNLLIDSVHFKPEYYAMMANNLLKRINPAR